MKYVYNNQELPHIFSKQDQATGWTQNKNMFFEGNKIYSYGHHFCIAYIDGMTAFINSNNYSNTTARHVSLVRSALNHYTTYIVPNPELGYHVDNIDSLIEDFKTTLNKHIRARKYNYFTDLESLAHTIHSLVNGLPLKKDRKKYVKDIDVMNKTLDSLFSDPDAVIKLRKQEKEARIAKQKLIEKKNRKQILEWKKGNIDYLSHTISTPYLRINKYFVETSKGARVDVSQAQILWRMIKDKRDVIGHNIGGYIVISKNGSLKIGCHNIPMAEVERIGAEIDTL